MPFVTKDAECHHIAERSMAASEFDFIVVGSGPAGASVAWRLANSKKAPSILLVEAGGLNSNIDWRVDAERWVSRFNPELNYNYITVPQKHVDNRQISYDRGRGLGGSSAINFCVWNIGPKDDHDEIARLAGDDDWKWDNAKERYKRIEDYHGFAPDIPSGMERYLNPKPEDRGRGGPIKIGMPRTWEPTLTKIMDIWADAGYKLRADLGDGDGIGLTVCPNTGFKGVRSTSADMVAGPSNLHIATNSQVVKVLFDGKAVGVETITGDVYRASKEVILSAGALDTPKILMLSGIGPREQLSKFGIPIVHENSAVGRNLIDHCHISPTWERRETPDMAARIAFYRASLEEKAAAREQWQKHRSGPLVEIGTNAALGMFKAPAVFTSKEFADLPDDTKHFLRAPTTPSYEIILDGPPIEYFVDPTNSPALAAFYIFVMNQQSRGSVTLQSADPKEPLLYDPNYFEHPFDRRVAVEAVREVLKVVEASAVSKDIVGPSAISGAPKSSSDEDILDYWKKNMSSTWHMAGTCKMGKSEEDGAVVDSKLRVFGVENLRVADMSVVPIMPNNHTQTTAYLVGLTLGDKLANQYGLDE